MIRVTCDRCGRELTEYGAVAWSPPAADNTCVKYHIGTCCFERFKELLAQRQPRSAEVAAAWDALGIAMTHLELDEAIRAKLEEKRREGFNLGVAAMHSDNLHALRRGSTNFSRYADWRDAEVTRPGCDTARAAPEPAPPVNTAAASPGMGAVEYCQFMEEAQARSQGYVPATDLHAAVTRAERAEREVEKFRSGIKCRDWVRAGWADAREWLARSGQDFARALLDEEARRRFMLAPDESIRADDEEVR
jgi:hypothetical protein